MNLIEELRWRGMISDIMPGTEEQLQKEVTAGYVGFDPTADSLHIGSLVPILLLVHMQKAGHKPIALVGGATGMVGDPSGKSDERNLLDEETLAKNIAGIKAQLSKFLDFTGGNANSAILVNNYDWFKEISFIGFLRDVGKYLTVNYMMSKDSVRKRIEGETGISYTEFAYQLMQGYDFYWLHKNLNCKLQFGGSDQWGNITTGTELVRRMTKGEGEAFAFTCPLITKADGGKFGKTEKGNIWLAGEKTSPYDFYQFWLNAKDPDAEKWIKIFTFLTKEQVDAILAEHSIDASKRILQKKLAAEVTSFVHGNEGLQAAIATTEKLFANREAAAESLSADELEALEGITKVNFAKEIFLNGVDAVSLLAETKIFSSKGESRKMIQGGGVKINRRKVDNPQLLIDVSLLLHDKYLLVQKGQKHHFLIVVE